MKKIKTLSLVVLINLSFSNLIFSQTAQINITIENFPYLLIEPYPFFKSEKEIKVEKVDMDNFKLIFYGKKPKSYFLNYREILISPGDSIDITFRNLNSDPSEHEDVLIASGSNKGNYIFSNYINSRMPENYYPDYKQEKYLNNIGLLCNTLKSNFDKYHKGVADTLKKYDTNKEFSAYILRTSNLKYLTALYYLNDNLKNYPKQRNELIKVIDSNFLNTNFVKSDTTYSYFMEVAFNNYFTKIVIPKFNNLVTETDYQSLINFIVSFPNNFIKEYFVYFLATDYRLAITKYHSYGYDELVKINPHVGKTRYVVMDKSNLYR